MNPRLHHFPDHSAMYSHHSAPKSDSPRNLRVLSFSALDFSSAPSSSSLHQSRITRHQPLSLFLSYFSKLFGTHQKRNPFVFKQIRTLSQKHPGWGIPSLIENQNDARCHQDEPDRRLATPSLSPATALPRPCRGHQSLVTPPSCRPLFRMLRFGVR